MNILIKKLYRARAAKFVCISFVIEINLSTFPTYTLNQYQKLNLIDILVENTELILAGYLR